MTILWNISMHCLMIIIVVILIYQGIKRSTFITAVEVENTNKYNDIPKKYNNNFYEYCTVTFLVEYREVTGKEVSEEMMIEFHVFKPSDYKSMKPEDMHIINLTAKNFDELKENLNEFGSGDFNLDDLNWDY